MGDMMARTRVSPKFQVVIPKEIRERHGVKPGLEMQVISKGGTITLVPDRPLSAFRGILQQDLHAVNRLDEEGHSLDVVFEMSASVRRLEGKILNCSDSSTLSSPASKDDGNRC